MSGLAACAAALSVGSCIDHDYDLQKDNLDLKVTVGGKFLTVPASSVQELTLSQILELDTCSSIREMTAQGVEGVMPGDYGLALGDYLLLQSGESNPTDFVIEEVSIDAMDPSVSRVELPRFIANGSADRVSCDAKIKNEIRLNQDNVTAEIVSLDRVDMHVVMRFTIGFESADFSRYAFIDKGYTASFSPSWTVEPIGETAEYLEQVDSHTLRFKNDYRIGAGRPVVCSVLLKSVDFNTLSLLAGTDDDQGLFEPGKFRVANDVEWHGKVSIASADLTAGASASLTLFTKAVVDSDPRILAVTGVVDPEIDVDPISLAITDIPEFLSDSENSLDIANPVIEFTVSNDSPLSINVNGKLSSFVSGDVEAQIGIGAEYGTKPVVVKPNSTMIFKVSREKLDDTPENIVVPDIGTLIKTIPDEILFSEVRCRAEQTPATYRLGHSYTFSTRYRAVIPLAFGPDMKLRYTHEDADWDSDLDKYNFNEVVLTLDAVNRIPLRMMPTATAIDRDRKPISNVKALVYTVLPDGTEYGGYDSTLPEGQRGDRAYIEAGTESGVTTPVMILLKSTGENIANLDGIEIVFDAESGDAGGVSLNSSQSLRFDNVKIRIRGGITVDLRSDD